jgi:hypothetical protein
LVTATGKLTISVKVIFVVGCKIKASSLCKKIIFIFLFKAKNNESMELGMGNVWQQIINMVVL